MKRLYCLIVISLFLGKTNSFSQISPHGDCITALPMCQFLNLSTAASLGEGLNPNEVNPTALYNCLTSGERNSTWLELSVLTSGLLSFSILPFNDNSDYDYAIYNLSNATCSDIFNDQSLMVDCNFSGSTFPSAVTGPNGGPNPQDGPPLQVLAGEHYVMIVNNFTGINNVGFSILMTALNTCTIGDCSTITGKVFVDADMDCIESFEEIVIEGTRVGLVNSLGIVKYDATSNAAGVFTLYYPQTTEDLSLQLVTASPFYSQSCASVPSVVPQSSGDQNIGNARIAVNVTLDCYYLSINHTNNRMRNCLNNSRYIQVMNNGPQSSPATVLTLAYPGYVFPSSTAIVLNYLDPNTVEVAIPEISPFSSFNFTINDSVACDAPAFSEACVNATLLNYTDCTEDFDETHLRINVNCAQSPPESIESITITNLNNIPIGPSRNFQLIAFNSLVYNESIELNGNSAITYPLAFADGSAMYISEPGNYQYINNLHCDPPQATEFFYQYSLLQGENPNTVTTCNVVFNSYDPNDKTGFPRGEGDDHLIGRDTPLKYVIRFQNTGNDTAYKVVIRDTLPDYLDESTVVKGLSSHPCRYERSLNELIFTFEPIALVDSATNEPESQGFIEFTVKQKSSNPVNYVINNSAAIYFDFNDPIFTNTYKYTVSPVTGFEQIPKVQFNVFPNPGSQLLNVSLDKSILKNNRPVLLTMTDYLGRVVHSESIKSTEFLINTEQLSSGLYLLECKVDGKSLGHSKWIKN